MWNHAQDKWQLTGHTWHLGFISCWQTIINLVKSQNNKAFGVVKHFTDSWVISISFCKYSSTAFWENGIQGTRLSFFLMKMRTRPYLHVRRIKSIYCEFFLEMFRNLKGMSSNLPVLIRNGWLKSNIVTMGLLVWVECLSDCNSRKTMSFITALSVTTVKYSRKSEI